MNGGRNHPEFDRSKFERREPSRTGLAPPPTALRAPAKGPSSSFKHCLQRSSLHQRPTLPSTSHIRPFLRSEHSQSTHDHSLSHSRRPFTSAWSPNESQSEDLVEPLHLCTTCKEGGGGEERQAVHSSLSFFHALFS